MSKFGFVGVSMLALVAATPVWAQDAGGDAPSGTTQSAEPDTQESYGEDIVVTAQRQSQRLQEVPIAVTAFTAEALESQQIENASDLQLTLPNITFTKANFTSSNFTIVRPAFMRMIFRCCPRACSKPSISIWSGSKYCAGRKARCMGAMRHRAWSTSSPRGLISRRSQPPDHSNTAITIRSRRPACSTCRSARRSASASPASI